MDGSEIEEFYNLLESETSYWVCKSKLMAFKASSEASELEIKLLEFDFALKFKRASDLALSAGQIFRLGKNNCEVTKRIKTLISMLMDLQDVKFSSDIFGAFPVEQLLEFSKCSFPDKNIANVTLFIYMAIINAHPKSLTILANKLFETYLALANDYKKSKDKDAVLITPYDAVFFNLAEKLIATEFGDMLPQNIFEIYQIMFNNVFEDTTGHILPEFYDVQISVNPRECWMRLARILSVHSAKLKSKSNLTEFFQQHKTLQSRNILDLLEWILASPNAISILDSELYKLFLAFSFAHLHNFPQQGPLKQMICLPANFYVIDPYSLQHYWIDNDGITDRTGPLIHCTTPQTDVPSSPKSDVGASSEFDLRNVNEKFVDSLKVLSLLFTNLNVANQQKLLEIVDTFDRTNAYSLVVLALMVNGSLQLALTLIETAIEKTSADSQKRLLETQQLQAQILTHNLIPAFQKCSILITSWINDPDYSEDQHSLPVTINERMSLLPIENVKSLVDFLLLSFFHICWLCFTKLQNEFDFLCCFLICITQTVWESIGFSLFQQLLQHILLRKAFKCCDLFAYLSNLALITQLLSLESVEFEINGRTLTSSDIYRMILDEEIQFAKEPPLRILERFLTENQSKFRDVFSQLK